MTTPSDPIKVPDVNPNQVLSELTKRSEAVREEIRRLEEAKKVSQATMSLVIDY